MANGHIAGNTEIDDSNTTLNNLKNNINDMMSKRLNCIMIGINNRHSINQPTDWGSVIVPLTKLLSLNDKDGCYTHLSDGTIRINKNGYYYATAQLCFMGKTKDTDYSCIVQRNGSNVFSNYCGGNGRWMTLNVAGIFYGHINDIISVGFMSGVAQNEDFLEEYMNHLSIIRLSY